jgi:hypothetical protein
MKEFINAASKEKLMRYSKKSKDAFVLACISLFINFMLIIYLLLIK